MDVEGKIRKDMKTLGCQSEKQITLGFHLYIHLVDVKLMYDTEYCFNNDISILYIVARPMKEGKLNIYVPITSQQDLTMEHINKLQENLCTVETGPTITLAIIESDMTMVFYTFTRGIFDRMAPSKITALRQRDEKRWFINTELKKRRHEILNDALNGGYVDADDPPRSS